jgi:hypothetical protein
MAIFVFCFKKWSNFQIILKYVNYFLSLDNKLLSSQFFLVSKSLY